MLGFMLVSSLGFLCLDFFDLPPLDLPLDLFLDSGVGVETDGPDSVLPDRRFFLEREDDDGDGVGFTLDVWGYDMVSRRSG